MLNFMLCVFYHNRHYILIISTNFPFTNKPEHAFSLDVECILILFLWVSCSAF